MSENANAHTLEAYEARADVYRAHSSGPAPDWTRAFCDGLGPAPPDRPWRVLELGSGTGDGARELAARGLDVQPSDATRAFVEMMRAGGLDPIELNALTDDLGGPWDGIVAFAVLLHFSPDELATVLAKARHGIRDGGVLTFTVKEGDGAGWSEHKLGLPRHFTYWRAEPLRAAVEAQGWRVETIERSRGHLDDWILVVATGVEAS